MRVDLHLHSNLSKKNGDAVKFLSIYDSFRRLKNFNVKICSFSDHNDFNSDLYLKNKNIAEKMGLLLLPGVELDVVRKYGKTGNIIVIFSENLSQNKLKELEKIIVYKTGKRKIRINKIEEIFKNFPKIIIPHVGKSDYCTYEDLESLNYDAIEITNRKHPNFKSFSNRLKKQNKETSIVAFSDTHIWTSYPQNSRLHTWIKDISSFDELKDKLRKNIDFVKET